MLRRGLALAVLLQISTVAMADGSDPRLRNRPLSEWIELLRGDASAEKRRGALLAIEMIGPGKSPRVLPAIIETLGDRDEKLQEAAALALGRLGERQAARTAGEPIPFTQGRDALAGVLRGNAKALSGGRVRAAAATALGKLDKSDIFIAMPELRGALTDVDPGTRAAAAETLRRLGKEAADAGPQLANALRDTDATVQTRAALALGNLGEATLAYLPALLALLDDAKAPVEPRRAAAETIGRVGAGASVASSHLGQLLALKSTPVELRRAVVEALDRIGVGSRPALAALRDSLSHEDRFVRSLALHAIAQQASVFGSEGQSVVEAVLVCLNDRVVEVRVAAAETLGNLGTMSLGADLMRVKARLRDAQGDGQKAVRDAAIEALKKLAP